jgi:hypothetical protein
MKTILSIKKCIISTFILLVTDGNYVYWQEILLVIGAFAVSLAWLIPIGMLMLGMFSHHKHGQHLQPILLAKLSGELAAPPNAVPKKWKQFCQLKMHHQFIYFMSVMVMILIDRKQLYW